MKRIQLRKAQRYSWQWKSELIGRFLCDRDRNSELWNLALHCKFHALEPRPLLFSRKGKMSRFEGELPSLFLRQLPSTANAKTVLTHSSEPIEKPGLGMTTHCTLAAAHEITLNVVVGYVFAEMEIELEQNQHCGAEIDVERTPLRIVTAKVVCGGLLSVKT